MRIFKAFMTGVAVTAISMSMVSMAHANPDEGLYDPQPPEGSAFIRFINDMPDDGSEEAIANGKTYDYLDYKEISSYFVVEGGPVDAYIGDQSNNFEAEAGKFYTVVLTDENAISVNQDKENENRAKAQISFYNLTDDESLSVKTSDGNVEVVPTVRKGEAGERQINPVKVSLGVFDGDELVKDIGSLSLDRANSYSIVAYTKDEVEWVQSTTNTTR